MSEYEGFELRINQSVRLLDDGEPSSYLNFWSGAVTLYRDADEGVEIGRFEATLVDVVGAMNDGMSVFDVFDTTQTTLEYFEALFDEAVDFKPSVLETAFGFDYPWNSNVLILDRLALLPAYRGRGRGLKVLRGLIQWLRAGAGLVVMKPFPLQGERHPPEEDEQTNRLLQLEQYPRDMRKATAKLVRHYKKLGFRKLPRTPYMVRDATEKLPSVEEIEAACAK